MEKRSQNRTEIVLPAEMVFRGVHTEGLTTRNVSLGGVLIEPGDYTLPRRGETVTLSLLDGQGDDGRRQFRAKVVRSDTEGVALVFQDFDLEDFAYLQELMG